MHFQDRVEAGRCLAKTLAQYALRTNVTLLALRPGAVPIALEAGRALGVAADYFAVAPIFAPATSDVLVGAVAEGGAVVLDEREIAARAIPMPLVQQAPASGRRTGLCGL